MRRRGEGALAAARGAWLASVVLAACAAVALAQRREATSMVLLENGDIVTSGNDLSSAALFVTRVTASGSIVWNTIVDQGSALGDSSSLQVVADRVYLLYKGSVEVGARPATQNLAAIVRAFNVETGVLLASHKYDELIGAAEENNARFLRTRPDMSAVAFFSEAQILGETVLTLFEVDLISVTPTRIVTVSRDCCLALQNPPRIADFMYTSDEEIVALGLGFNAPGDQFVIDGVVLVARFSSVTLGFSRVALVEEIASITNEAVRLLRDPVSGDFFGLVNTEENVTGSLPGDTIVGSKHFVVSRFDSELENFLWTSQIAGAESSQFARDMDLRPGSDQLWIAGYSGDFTFGDFVVSAPGAPPHALVAILGQDDGEFRDMVVPFSSGNSDQVNAIEFFGDERSYALGGEFNNGFDLPVTVLELPPLPVAPLESETETEEPVPTDMEATELPTETESEPVPSETEAEPSPLETELEPVESETETETPFETETETETPSETETEVVTETETETETESPTESESETPTESESASGTPCPTPPIFPRVETQPIPGYFRVFQTVRFIGPGINDICNYDVELNELFVTSSAQQTFTDERLWIVNEIVETSLGPVRQTEGPVAVDVGYTSYAKSLSVPFYNGSYSEYIDNGLMAEYLRENNYSVTSVTFLERPYLQDDSGDLGSRGISGGGIGAIALGGVMAAGFGGFIANEITATAAVGAAAA